jgi:hypothetical protein
MYGSWGMKGEERPKMTEREGEKVQRQMPDHAEANQRDEKTRLMTDGEGKGLVIGKARPPTHKARYLGKEKGTHKK